MRRLLLLLALLALASGATAQPPSFGSADDPLELGSAPFSPDRTILEAHAGPAFVRSDWRTGLRGEATVLRGRFSASVGGAVHPGGGGFYENEADDLYDALRVIRYIRVQPRGGRRGIYARVGPLDGVTLGTGMLARRYRTTAAWDERRIGAEFASGARGGARVAAFIGDVTGGSVAGAEVEIPTRLALGPARGVRLGLAAAHDLSLPASGDSALTGIEATLRGDVFSEGGLSVGPYVSFAQVLGKGGGIGVGLVADGADLGSVARAEARLGLVFSRGRFSPGIVGPMYSVNGGRQRIVAANSFYDDQAGFDLAGTPIDSMRGGVDLELELRSVAFGRVEALLFTRRHFGPGALSAFSLSLAARGGPARFEFGVEKQGFRSLLGIFGSALGEENTLLLDISFPVPALGGAHAFVRSRYGYRRLADDEAGPQRYLVERRFEPLIGVRTRW